MTFIHYALFPIKFLLSLTCKRLRNIISKFEHWTPSAWSFQCFSNWMRFHSDLALTQLFYWQLLFVMQWLLYNSEDNFCLFWIYRVLICSYFFYWQVLFVMHIVKITFFILNIPCLNLFLFLLLTDTFCYAMTISISIVKISLCILNIYHVF